MDITKLREEAAELHQQSVAITNKAEAETRSLTAEEMDRLDAILAEFDAKQAEIDRHARIQANENILAQPAGRKTADKPAAPYVTVSDNRLDARNWGWKSFGEFANAVVSASTKNSTDPRLISNALSTYGSEGVAADGGFAVPPEWRSQIMDAVAGEESLLARTDRQTAAGNSITFPVDETTAWQTSGGILSYWDGEASTMTQSKPALQDVTIKLNRVTALVPVTDELLEDAPAMGSYVARKAGEKIAYKVNNAIINGTGVGQPLGIMNAACTVSVAKESSQTATTFHAANAVKMMARMPAQSFARSVWLINQDVVPQILQLGFPVTTAAGTASGGGALYLPPQGIYSGSPYGVLLGRPIVVTEACATLGTVGDVILADLSNYLTVVKSSGLRSDSSIHLWFDQNVTAFRFVLRVGGQPWLSAAIARANGSNTLSHFITLATRS